MISEFFKSPFLFPALGFALFFGWRSVYIFVHPDIYRIKKLDWWLYQFWFNFVGAFIGWVVVYYLWKTDISKFGIEHFVALIIAFLGITGNLPYAVLIGELRISQVKKQIESSLQKGK